VASSRPERILRRTADATAHNVHVMIDEPNPSRRRP